MAMAVFRVSVTDFLSPQVTEDPIMTHPIQTEDSYVGPPCLPAVRFNCSFTHSTSKKRKKTKNGTVEKAQGTINNVQQAPARWNLYVR